MYYLYLYLGVLGFMFVFQTYRLATTYFWWLREGYKFRVFTNVIGNEMFWFNRLTCILTIVSLPNLILWNILAVVVLVTAILCLICLAVIVLMWKLLRFILNIIKQAVSPLFTINFWLGRL